MQSGEIAELLGLSKNTVLNWTRDFGRFLSEDAAGRPKGATREFTEADLYVFATIKERRDLGLTTPQIEQVLERGVRAMHLPEKPDPAVQAAKDRVELVPTQDVTLWMDRYQTLQAEMSRIVMLHREEVERLVSERNLALSKSDQERDSRIEAEKRAARLEGEMQRLTESLLQQQQHLQQLQTENQGQNAYIIQMQQALGQVQELQNQIAYLQWLLNEEKNRKHGLFGD